jgi:hypothetical protein
VGYFFAVASPDPFDFSSFRFSPYARGWDLGLVGRRVYRDPYLAMDDYVAALIPDWERAPYALDFVGYHVGERYEYPRFLCYDCHGFRGYATWNPYYAACTTFRVVIYDDPYFYPARRYRSDRVVWTRPLTPGRPRFAFKERASGEPVGPLVQARTSAPPGVVSSPPRRSPSAGAGGVVTGPARVDQERVDTEPVDLGVFRGSRGGADPDAGSSGRTPSRAIRERPSGVVAPAPRSSLPGSPAGPTGGPEADPSRNTPVERDPRSRPVLRRRPSEEARPDPERPGAVTAPSRGNGTPSRGAPTAPVARPRGGSTAPAPSGSSPPTRARPRSGGASAPSSEGGAGPVVRRTPAGRPVVRPRR